ncbi:hypothetical protein LX36DRAFT_674164 [Colletotrichum falcatum]|nr:hypothetical protein LX36DRAFT_674164 [Colletotrichum falcatum]
MRTSILAVVSVVALLSSSKAVAADEKAGKPGRQAETQHFPVPFQPKHDARSPQELHGFVSYDYGYSYPPPPPPTTYAELSSSSSSSSTVTSLASSGDASYTECLWFRSIELRRLYKRSCHPLWQCFHLSACLGYCNSFRFYCHFWKPQLYDFLRSKLVCVEFGR